MSNEEWVTITKNHFQSLKESERILFALEEFGVDNWEGYGDALQSLREDDDE